MIEATISHYQILRKLGEGGMGEVYLAEDTRLHRKVALKFLPPKYTADPDFKARFEREAQAAAGFNHPNIVTIYEIGEYQGRSYIAMEHVEGESMRELIGREKPPLPRVIEMVLQVCAGLSQAHQSGIVHRDLKPANILLNAEGQVKIVDFGLAKLQGVSKLTRTGTVMGTVPYMSPEQVRGHELDPRSDIFSLGIVLYELLTGELPFGADSQLGVMNAIASLEPRPLADYQLDIPPGLQNILDQALRKDLAKRYQRIEDLAAALKNLAEGGEKYQLLQRLEAGGMGEVYLAQDWELGRKVVLKFLPAHYNQDPELKARLKREAQAAAALNHPNIITVYGVGEYKGAGEYKDRAYIAMEYVEGESLKTRIASQKLALPEIVDIMTQICAGMSKAHRAGVLHRDIKPANILLNLDGHVKVIDFGLAKVAGVSKLTKAGTLMGTIPYMSPEQVHGADLDQRSDIFSLGIVLYELLTRELPFKGETEFILMNAIVREQPAKLECYPLFAPLEWQGLIDKVLAKNPAARYQRVDELSADLKKLLKLVTQPPRPRPGWDETVAIDEKPQRTFKLSRAVTLSLAAAIVIILAVFLIPKLSGKKTAAKTTLSLATQPPGAAVFLNGDSLGMTPFNAPMAQEGAVALRFRKRGFVTFDTAIVIQKGVAQNFSAALQPAGRIAIAVDPPDAEVQVDGEIIPASDLGKLELAAGMHAIRISRSGYNIKDEEFRLRAGDNAARRFALEKLAPGVGGVEIEAQPPGAEITFNGARVGNTRYQAQNLEPRRYPFSLSLNGYKTYSGSVIVRAGQTMPLKITLEPAAAVAALVGKLSVKSEPEGASIELNGKVIGATPYESNNTPVGQYEIVLRKKDYKNYSAAVAVEAGKSSPIEAKLSPAVATLQVLVVPFGSIYIDGELKKRDANFRFALDVQAGARKLRVTHPNYGLYEKTVSLEADTPQEIEVDFNRQFAVTVTSTDETGNNPVWSNIEVDGKPTGNATPKQLTLRFGTHTLEVKRPGYEPVDGPMTINVEGNTSLRFRLKKLP